MSSIIDLLHAKELDKYEILDSQPEVSFNNIVNLASKLLEAPYAVISFLDGDRVWFKARVGIEEQQISKVDSICNIAIKEEHICIIEDLSKNNLTKDLDICKSKYNIKFYCGIPLKNKKGITLGLLVIMDTRARRLEEREIDVLKDLASAVVNCLELRLKHRASEKKNNQLILMLAHDVKNFIGNVQASIPILVEANKNADTKMFNELVSLIESFTKKNAESINHCITKIKSKEFITDFEILNVDITTLLIELIDKNKLNAQTKKQTLKFKTNNENVFAHIDRECMFEAIDNLINNAIKFSPFNRLIQVNLKCETEIITIDVIDQGPGLTMDDLAKIFHVKTSLTAKPTGDEVSTGIGLWLAYQIVQSHGGKLYAQNNCNGKGTKFTIELIAPLHNKH